MRLTTAAFSVAPPSTAPSESEVISIPPSDVPCSELDSLSASASEAASDGDGIVVDAASVVAPEALTDITPDDPDDAAFVDDIAEAPLSSPLDAIDVLIDPAGAELPHAERAIGRTATPAHRAAIACPTFPWALASSERSRRAFMKGYCV
jgi:hypothetical protein